MPDLDLDCPDCATIAKADGDILPPACAAHGGGRMLSKIAAEKIWQILVEEEILYDNDSGRSDFLYHQTREQCSEFRLLSSSLSFGAKFRNKGSVWVVDIYPEDSSPAKVAKLAKTNARLAVLYTKLSK
jgi:hypothetical protein